MKRENQLALIVAYYLSKFDANGMANLGYTGWTEAWLDIETKLGVKAATVKNLRDSFDPFNDNPRAGWHQRPLSPRSVRVIETFGNMDEEALRRTVGDIINSPSFRESEHANQILAAIAPEDLKGSGAPSEARESPNPSKPEPTPTLDLTTITDTFATALDASHLRIAPNLVRAFIAALTTKRLAILTGLSGSGKTQIALRFGQWLGQDRYRLEAVRPDWTGPEALHGYEDALVTPRGAWHVPGALEFMLKAANDPQNPYLLILDEMNLAHVERYFADILSGMESDEPVIPNLKPDPTDGHYRIPKGEDNKRPFPRNLFVVGTVNVDETTYMFSPKVLDRANTFEFRVQTTDLRTDLQKPKDLQAGDPSLVRGFLAIAQDDDWQTKHPVDNLTDYTDNLKELHTILSEGGFEFGHRVFYEAIRFAAMLQSAGNTDINHALDLQIMQKLLPRLHGTRRHLEPILTQLKTYCADKYPISHDKVQRMIKRVQANQFVSFAE